MYKKSFAAYIFLPEILYIISMIVLSLKMIIGLDNKYTIPIAAIIFIVGALFDIYIRYKYRMLARKQFPIAMSIIIFNGVMYNIDNKNYIIAYALIFLQIAATLFLNRNIIKYYNNFYKTYQNS